MKKNLKPKIYAGIVLVCFLAVLVRIGLVNADRGRTIVSFVAEWEKSGKPVTVERIEAKDVPVYTKLTIREIEQKRGAGFVTGDIKDKLQEGQEVCRSDTGGPCGTITALGRELDTDTGMFPVEIEFSEAVPAGALSVVFVRTHLLSNVLVVPNEILDFSGGEYYLWKIEDAQAKRVQVKIGARNGYGTVISEGIHANDLIIFDGRSMLSENDTVRIVSDTAAGRTDAKGRAL
jgi:multidrug efflux pump subunit AcrA (membrane-fusion protein)